MFEALIFWVVISSAWPSRCEQSRMVRDLWITWPFYLSDYRNARTVTAGTSYGQSIQHSKRFNFKRGWVNRWIITCHLRGSYRTNFGFVLASRKQGLEPVSEGRSYSLRSDKKNPRLKYARAGPLLQHTPPFRMTSNGFLLIFNSCKIKISVVSFARESSVKRCDFSFVYNCLLFIAF